jgi:transposase
MERYADKLKDDALRDLLGCILRKIFEGGGDSYRQIDKHFKIHTETAK